MYQAITDDIMVKVTSYFHDSASQAMLSNYIFAYRIFIENQSDETVRLLSRHWYIVDSNGSHEEVIGEGVVGLQPTLRPLDTHEYMSGCHLRTDMGKMYGTYTMERLKDGSTFRVVIPEFSLIVPARLN